MTEQLGARLADRRTPTYARLLKESGQVASPSAMARRSIDRALKASALAIPLALLSSVLLYPWLLAVGLVPLAVALGPEFQLRDAVAQRREGVERELPFFSVLVGVLGGAGTPLYSIMQDLGSDEIFPRMKREAMLVRRDVEVFGMNPNESFERLAANHPSKKFRDFLLGYTSKARSGGDIPIYLGSESESLLKDLETGWTRYVARVGIIGSMMVTVFGVVPLLLMVVGVFSPAFSSFGLIAFTALGVPMFTVGLLYMAGRMNPMREEGVAGKPLRCLAVAAPAGIAGLATGFVWAGAAGAMLTFFALYGYSIRRQISEAQELEVGTSRFLKDILEFKRQEYDLTKAVVSLEAQGGYGRSLGSVLAKVAAQLRAGVPLEDVRVHCRTRLCQMSFLMLGKMSQSGGGTVDTVYQVSRFADKLTEMKRGATAEIKPYLAISYFSPLLLAFGVTFVGGVVSSFSRRLSPGITNLHVSLLPGAATVPGLTQVSDLLIVVSAAALGLIGAKMADFTVKNTTRAATNVAIAVCAIVAIGTFGILPAGMALPI